jgi:hypothetical protein
MTRPRPSLLLLALAIVLLLGAPAGSMAVGAPADHTILPQPNGSSRPMTLAAPILGERTASDLGRPRALEAVGPDPFGVNPNATYTSEPAPMGITDYGVTPNGSAYSYATPMFQANATISALAASSPSAGTSVSFQLNVEAVVSGGSSEYVYWIQDVAFYDTNDTNIQWEDNVWNLTKPGAGLPANSVSGNGSNLDGYLYADSAGAYAGNDVDLGLPATFEARVVASNASGTAHVAFEYSDDGSGWQTYDNVTFPFLTTSVVDGFVVDGTQYLPGDGGFYDAEWDLAGPGDGLSQNVQEANLSMTLSYWNGHNLENVRAAYDHGADTAETVRNVVDTASSVDGAPSAQLTNGTAPLGALYGPSTTSTLSVSLPQTPNGTIAVNGTLVPYVGGTAELTLAPGTYSVTLVAGAATLARVNASLTAGHRTAITLTPYALYSVEFMESGLPSGTPWNVAWSSASLSGSSSTIGTTARNGSYTYSIAGIPGYYLSSYRGTVDVSGQAQFVNLTWYPTVYSVLFVAENYLSGTLWSVSIDGTSAAASVANLSVTLQNGSYPFSVSVPTTVLVTVQSTTVDVDGAPSTTFVSFAVAPGTLAGTVDPGNASLTLDGAPVALRGGTFNVSVPPGSYTLVASLPGFGTWTRTIQVLPGGTADEVIVLTPLSPTGSPGSTAGTGGGGVPALDVFAVAAVVAVAAVAIGVAVVLTRRRPPRSP